METLWSYRLGSGNSQSTWSQRVQVTLFVSLLKFEKTLPKLCGIGLKYLFVYLLRHRFVLPILPIALMFSGYSLAALRYQTSSNGKRAKSRDLHTKRPMKMNLAIIFLLTTNIPMGLYMSLVHQVAVYIGQRV